LIADEPTTALDVTIQAQMLALLLRLQQERGMALMLITHDLGVVAEIAQRVLVMYAGQIVETAPVPQLFETPHHPYTEALLAALPEHNIGRRRLRSMPGMVPGAGDRPAGCLLAPRCAYVQPRCIAERPDLFELGGESRSRCFFAPNTPAAVAPSRGWIAGGQAGDEPITDEPIAAARIADGGLSGRVVDRSR
jgi:dipeptide transport system ATP-binding protein